MFVYYSVRTSTLFMSLEKKDEFRAKNASFSQAIKTFILVTFYVSLETNLERVSNNDLLDPLCLRIRQR